MSASGGRYAALALARVDIRGPVEVVRLAVGDHRGRCGGPVAPEGALAVAVDEPACVDRPVLVGPGPGAVALAQTRSSSRTCRAGRAAGRSPRSRSTPERRRGRRHDPRRRSCRTASCPGCRGLLRSRPGSSLPSRNRWRASREARGLRWRPTRTRDSRRIRRRARAPTLRRRAAAAGRNGACGSADVEDGGPATRLLQDCPSLRHSLSDSVSEVLPLPVPPPGPPRDCTG